MDEFNHLYCSVCAREAIRQHFIVKGRGHKAPEFIAVSSGVVRERARDVWEVPRAHVVFGGASLCLFHMGTKMAEQTPIDDPGTGQESPLPSAPPAGPPVTPSRTLPQ